MIFVIKSVPDCRRLSISRNQHFIAGYESASKLLHMTQQKAWKPLQHRHWIMVAVTLLLFVLVAFFVDLKPEVIENFFFSPKDPEFQQTSKIDKLFPGGSQMIVNVAGQSTLPPIWKKSGGSRVRSKASRV